ncbi:Gfo/Idh/MocA family protein [Streptomyces tagetis]|uniref:Gfo/Idh/MocA family oxidoreductase n=1 Tax=Streptomyces tagetis TaxID=2820809 RepID=A0A940XIC9_9ACTN|nr:Gfo/Idh/MocA family oxidoreductase [Streptomyces sp. RG38]MBQ0825059.1 Gfo/Idh/MocA family oxidoreductase [Streptomyces sp. RG38]
MKRLSFGVLGCASIARRKMLPALVSHPRVRLAAVASRNADKAERCAAAFGCDAVTGYDRLLERPDIDAVYLPLPAGVRAEWITRALSAGKHVLAEKPLAVSADRARELVALARARGLLLMENFMFLQHSAHRTVRELVAAGRIGEPRAFTATFTIPPLPKDDIRHRPELGGGALLDLGTYTARAAQMFCGPGLVPVGTVLVTDPATGVDVSGAALLAAGEVTAQLSFGMAHAYVCRYGLTGSTGTLTLDRAFTPPPTWQPILRLESQDRTEELRLPADDHFAGTVGAFTFAVLDDGDFTAHDDDVVRQAELLDGIRRTAGSSPTA